MRSGRFLPNLRRWRRSALGCKQGVRSSSQPIFPEDTLSVQVFESPYLHQTSGERLPGRASPPAMTILPRHSTEGVVTREKGKAPASVQ